MKNFLYKIKYLSKTLLRPINKHLKALAEELKSIARNRKYMVKYPKLFAIFAIIEHEQSTQVFELNHDDFELIKNEILHDNKVNNHHILEALRGIFQNVAPTNFDNKIKHEILQYIYEELSRLIKHQNSYFDLLIKAILRGFPLLINYQDYAIFKQLLQQRSNKSLRMIKYILENENFSGVFLKEDDLAELILMAHQLNNKAAFMLLIKYLRKNNLLEIIFVKNLLDIKSKIISVHSFEKRSVDYSAVMLAYYDDKWLSNEKKIERIEQFLREIFSHHLGLNQQQKLDNYGRLTIAILMARKSGYNNFMLEKVLQEISDRYIDDANFIVKKTSFSFLPKLIQLRGYRPSTHIVAQEFSIISNLLPEESWLQKHAAYLL